MKFSIGIIPGQERHWLGKNHYTIFYIYDNEKMALTYYDLLEYHRLKDSVDLRDLKRLEMYRNNAEIIYNSELLIRLVTYER